MLYDLFIAPFVEHDYMPRAFAAMLALAFGSAPIGVFLMLRRMSLVGDATSHAILPGVAAGFLVSGMNPFVMTAGGLVAGLIVAVGASAIARATELKEDASFAAFFLISLAIGVAIIAATGSDDELLHVLFGSVQALDGGKLLLIVSTATVSLFVLALISRPLVLETVDPGFLRSVSRAGAPTHIAFMALVVTNLVGGFHALGTLLAVANMMLPAIVARFWARDITMMITIAVATAVLSGYAGVLVSYHAGLPSGPAVVLVAGVFYAVSVIVGPVGGLFWRAFPGRHLEA